MSRTIIKTFQFRCDHPGCEAEISVTPAHTGPFAPWDLANMEIRSASWIIRGRAQHAQKHYCPDHKPETVSTPT